MAQNNQRRPRNERPQDRRGRRGRRPSDEDEPDIEANAAEAFIMGKTPAQELPAVLSKGLEKLVTPYNIARAVFLAELYSGEKNSVEIEKLRREFVKTRDTLLERVIDNVAKLSEDRQKEALLNIKQTFFEKEQKGVELVAPGKPVVVIETQSNKVRAFLEGQKLEAPTQPAPDETETVPQQGDRTKEKDPAQKNELDPFFAASEKHFEEFTAAHDAYVSILKDKNTSREEVAKARERYSVARAILTVSVHIEHEKDARKLSKAELRRKLDAYFREDEKKLDPYINLWLNIRRDEPLWDPASRNTPTRPSVPDRRPLPNRERQEPRDLPPRDGRKRGDIEAKGEVSLAKRAYEDARADFLGVANDPERKEGEFRTERKRYLLALKDYVLTVQGALREDFPQENGVDTPDYIRGIDALVHPLLSDTEGPGAHIDLVREFARDPELFNLLKDRVPEKYKGSARALVDALKDSPLDRGITGELDNRLEQAKEDFMKARFAFLNAYFDWRDKLSWFNLGGKFSHDTARRKYEQARDRVAREVKRRHWGREEGALSQARKDQLLRKLYADEQQLELEIEKATLSVRQAQTLERAERAAAKLRTAISTSVSGGSPQDTP